MAPSTRRSWTENFIKMEILGKNKRIRTSVSDIELSGYQFEKSVITTVSFLW